MVTTITQQVCYIKNHTFTGAAKMYKKMNLSMFCVYCEVVNPFCLF